MNNFKCSIEVDSIQRKSFSVSNNDEELNETQVNDLLKKFKSFFNDNIIKDSCINLPSRFDYTIKYLCTDSSNFYTKTKHTYITHKNVEKLISKLISRYINGEICNLVILNFRVAKEGDTSYQTIYYSNDQRYEFLKSDLNK